MKTRFLTVIALICIAALTVSLYLATHRPTVSGAATEVFLPETGKLGDLMSEKENTQDCGWPTHSQLRDLTGAPGQSKSQHPPTGVRSHRR